MLALVLVCVVGQVNADDLRQFEENRRTLQEITDSWKSDKKIGIAVAGEEPHESMDPSSLNTDDVGYLEQWQYSIVDIVGKSDMIVAMRLKKFPPLWIKNFPTKDLADGDKVRLVGLVRVTGTKSYAAVDGGGNTIRVIEFLSEEEIADIKAAEVALKESALTRTWRDNTGSFETVGKFLGFKNNKVNIERKSDGKILSVPMSRLSKVDQEWIRVELKNRKEEKKAKPQHSPPS